MERFRVFPILVLMLGVVSSSFAQETELARKGLEQRVDFWKKVYTQYGKDDVIIHDSYYVNLIYDVATDDDARAKMAAVRDTLQELRAGLDKPESWSEGTTRIAAAITAQGIPLTTASLNDLLGNLHTQLGVKERFRDGIVRSGKYVDDFRQIIKAAGVPEDLALLPLVESSFENVRSKADAIGMWQFTRSTGRQYMTISNTTDDRLDPIKATKGAARMLADNYKALGEWPLAITAYNHGRAGMMRAKDQEGSDLTKIIKNYRGPVFGYASMNFYSEFLAAVDVYKSYATYFGELTLDKPTQTSQPQVQMASAKATAPAKAPVVSNAKYKVQRGDTLWDLAQKFGTSMRSLMEMNNLKESAIYAGQILLVK